MKPTFLFLLIGSALCAREIPVANPAELDALSRQADAGDTFVLAAGTFADVPVRFHGEGTKEKPITLRAAEPGKTIFTGTSSLKLGGQHLHVEGLHFRQPGAQVSEVIQLRIDSKKLAHHCTLRQVAVTADPTSQQGEGSKWLSIYGSHNLIEHCTFTGKTSGGTTVVVWLTEEGGEGGHHTIKECYFGPRPRLGKNGGETLRIGDSDTAHLDAHCIVTGCFFEQCNGETEIISNKSCANRYVGNQFLECEGTLTLRHGHRCLVEENVFWGNHKRMTGGVRVIGEDHVVRRNVMYQLQGDGHRSALTFMNGIPATPANGYQQVKRALIEDNLIAECKVPVTIGRADHDRCTEAPLAVTFRSNTIVSQKGQAIHLETPVTDWKWEGNRIQAPELGAAIDGLGLMENVTYPIPAKPQRGKTGASWWQ
jgi:poly(beta-D-mannuronate) lyase